ncbi:MAG: MBL fold metallo-hydrolase [Gemmatimonadetes bacterium]|nr:MBL fold metallo-hydrolase [Gemmatimonadota bacterium]
MQVADGVYASVVEDPEIYSQFSNSLIVIGDEGVLVVDPRESTAAGHALIGEIRSITDVPVRWVVNSHWHWDHLGGNQAFLEAFPGVEILAHPETGRLLDSEGRGRFEDEVQRLVDRRVRLLETAERGTTDSGRPLTEEDRATIDAFLERDEVRRSALEQTELFGPTRTVDGRVALELGRRALVLAPVAAHTPGDLVVWLPDVGILYAGDLVEHGFPWVGDGNAFAMAESLDGLARLEPMVVVPGHGPVPEDRRLFDGQLGFWTHVRALVESAAAGNETTAEDLRDPATPWPDAIDGLVGRISPGAFPGGFDPEGDPTDRLRAFVEESVLQALNDRDER